MKFVFKGRAEKELKKLDFQIRVRILEKFQFYASNKSPLIFAESLNNFRYGNWRFCIGEYRILFDTEGDTIIILKVGHREDVYK